MPLCRLQKNLKQQSNRQSCTCRLVNLIVSLSSLFFPPFTFSLVLLSTTDATAPIMSVFIRCADDSVLVLAGAGCTLVHLSGDSHYLAEAVSLRLPADPFAGGLVMSSSYEACGKERGMIYFGDTTSTGGGRFVLTMTMNECGSFEELFVQNCCCCFYFFFCC